MLLSEFSGKRIVITGASGYIGTALMQRLWNTACEIDLVSRRSINAPQPSNGVARIRNTWADLTQSDTWDAILAEADIVFHLSAQTNLYFAEEHPQQDAKMNVEPVRQLIEAARRLKTCRLKVVLASAATIVGNDHDNPVDESFADNPISVYDRHKRECECLLATATAAGNLRGCSLRLSNVYGHGIVSRNANRSILNMMMKRAAKGEALTVYGKGEYLRDFIHIDDVVEAFCDAATSNRTDDGRHFIIASEQGHSVREAFEMIANEASPALGKNVNVTEVPEPTGLHPIERRNFTGNCALFRCTVGWRQTISLREGIRRDLLKFASESDA